MENLAEKSLLLRESRHRQKNNINILLGLLKLEEKKFNTSQTREIYNKLVSRLESMSIIYDRLNNTLESDHISTKTYFETFFKKLNELYDDGRIIQELEIEEFELHHDIVSQLSIMINELYTNSVKYAFPVRKKCIIYFSIERNEDVVEIKYSDNGEGFKDTADNEGFGLKLFHALVKQLNAEVEIVDNRYHIKIGNVKLREPKAFMQNPNVRFSLENGH